MTQYKHTVARVKQPKPSTKSANDTEIKKLQSLVQQQQSQIGQLNRDLRRLQREVDTAIEAFNRFNQRHG